MNPTPSKLNKSLCSRQEGSNPDEKVVSKDSTVSHVPQEVTSVNCQSQNL